jgi:hypothetical protein
MTDLFTPLVDDPAYRKIANLIEQRIVARSLRTGDALPSETTARRSVKRFANWKSTDCWDANAARSACGSLAPSPTA